MWEEKRYKNSQGAIESKKGRSNARKTKVDRRSESEDNNNKFYTYCICFTKGQKYLKKKNIQSNIRSKLRD